MTCFFLAHTICIHFVQSGYGLDIDSGVSFLANVIPPWLSSHGGDLDELGPLVRSLALAFLHCLGLFRARGTRVARPWDRRQLCPPVPPGHIRSQRNPTRKSGSQRLPQEEKQDVPRSNRYEYSLIPNKPNPFCAPTPKESPSPACLPPAGTPFSFFFRRHLTDAACHRCSCAAFQCGKLTLYSTGFREECREEAGDELREEAELSEIVGQKRRGEMVRLE